MFGDDAVAHAEAARLRRFHAAIVGTDASGHAYRALDPEAYAWVHLSLAQLGYDTCRLLATPLTLAQADEFYQEWRWIGLRLGVRDECMPPTWWSFRQYADAMVRDHLEDNPAVRDVLDIVRWPPRPSRWVPDRFWAPVADVGGDWQTLLTIGALPEPLRQTVGVTWTEADERRMWTVARWVRRLAGLAPPPVRYVPLVNPLIRFRRDRP